MTRVLRSKQTEDVSSKTPVNRREIIKKTESGNKTENKGKIRLEKLLVLPSTTRNTRQALGDITNPQSSLTPNSRVLNSNVTAQLDQFQKNQTDQYIKRVSRNENVNPNSRDQTETVHEKRKFHSPENDNLEAKKAKETKEHVSLKSNKSHEVSKNYVQLNSNAGEATSSEKIHAACEENATIKQNRRSSARLSAKEKLSGSSKKLETPVQQSNADSGLEKLNESSERNLSRKVPDFKSKKSDVDGNNKIEISPRKSFRLLTKSGHEKRNSHCPCCDNSIRPETPKSRRLKSNLVAHSKLSKSDGGKSTKVVKTVKFSPRTSAGSSKSPKSGFLISKNVKEPVYKQIQQSQNQTTDEKLHEYDFELEEYDFELAENENLNGKKNLKRTKKNQRAKDRNKIKKKENLVKSVMRIAHSSEKRKPLAPINVSNTQQQYQGQQTNFSSLVETPEHYTVTKNAIPETSKNVTIAENSLPGSFKAVATTENARPGTSKDVTIDAFAIPGTSRDLTIADYAVPGTSKDVGYAVPGTSKDAAIADYAIPGTSKDADYAVPGTSKDASIADYAIPETSRNITIADYAEPGTAKEVTLADDALPGTSKGYIEAEGTMPSTSKGDLMTEVAESVTSKEETSSLKDTSTQHSSPKSSSSSPFPWSPPSMSSISDDDDDEPVITPDSYIHKETPSKFFKTIPVSERIALKDHSIPSIIENTIKPTRKSKKSKKRYSVKKPISPYRSVNKNPPIKVQESSENVQHSVSLKDHKSAPESELNSSLPSIFGDQLFPECLLNSSQEEILNDLQKCFQESLSTKELQSDGKIFSQSVENTTGNHNEEYSSFIIDKMPGVRSSTPLKSNSEKKKEVSTFDTSNCFGFEESESNIELPISPIKNIFKKPVSVKKSQENTNMNPSQVIELLRAEVKEKERSASCEESSSIRSSEQSNNSKVADVTKELDISHDPIFGDIDTTTNVNDEWGTEKVKTKPQKKQRKKRVNKRNKDEQSKEELKDMEKWANALNAQFQEIDKFNLSVE